MKRFIYLSAILALAVLFAAPTFAQVVLTPDTVYVAVLPAGNVNNVVNGDTLAGGLRQHPNRAYKLRRGSVYQVTAPMSVNGSIIIIANDTTGNVRPPVLAPAILADNSSIDHFFDFVGKGGKVTMKNIYLLSVRADQAQLGWSDGFRVGADSVKIWLRGCIFDAFSDAGITTSGQWCKYDIQDCVFRNHQHSSSWFGGQPLMSGSPVHVDTMRVVNNTFFANNSYSWSIRGFDKFSLFEHNTMVFGTVNPFLIRQGSNMRIRNNVFYMMHAMGGNPDHVINSWFLNYPDTGSSPIIQYRGLDTVSAWYHLWGNSAISGPNAYVDSAHGVTVATVDPSKRLLDLRSNDYFWPQNYLSFVKGYNDTVATYDSVDVPNGSPSEVKAYLKHILYYPTWLSKYAQWTIDSLAGKYSTMITNRSNQSQDPGFPAIVTNHSANLINYVWKISTGKLDTTWFYHPTAAMYPPVWPLPENLTYTNASLQNAGTDGFALGDLNWFPSQKTAWALTGIVTTGQGTPETYALSQNYPNPFNPSTKIDFSIPKASNVEMKVYNVLGQVLATLVNAPLAAGNHTVTFDAQNLASGVYFYSIKAGEFSSVKKMMLLK